LEEPAGLVYRVARADDVASASKVFADAFNHLSERHGFGGHPLSPVPPNPFFAFTLQDQPEGFWVAEDRGMVVGFAISRVYGPFWFLAYLFISPGCQSRGVGRALLERALRNEGGSTITNRGLITLAYNPVSISLYMKYGMYPRDSLYWMTGPSEEVRARRPAPATGDLVKLGADQAGLSRLARIDEDVIGFARDRLHAYLLHAPGSSCYLFPGHGIADGYAYVWPNGRVGPLAATNTSQFEGIMATALSLSAASGAEQTFCVVPGANSQAVSLALECGLRLSFPCLLMSSQPFGHWERYLFHSPGLM